MQVSNEMTSLIRGKFASSAADEIVAAVVTLEEENFDKQDPDRIVGAIVILAHRNIDKLPAIIRSAAFDWRDLLMGAGLADDDWLLRFGEITDSWPGMV
jgi:RHS repeat-associated protein